MPLQGAGEGIRNLSIVSEVMAYMAAPIQSFLETKERRVT